MFAKRGEGLRNQCKPCRSEYHREWYKKNREAVLERVSNYKDDNPDYNREYYSRTREHRLEWQRKYDEDNKLARASKQREHYRQNKGERDAYASQWRRDNPDKSNAYNAERRAGKLKATPSWLSEQHKESIAQVYAECSTLSKETGEPHHVDHIVPLKNPTVCGLHVPWNLQILTKQENSVKSNKHDDWG